MSWDELDQMSQPQDVRAVEQKREDADRLCLRVLGTEDGQLLMKWLRETILEQPVAVPGSPADFAFYRVGQNSLIRDLEARLNRARKP
jgi:hypothetical protein